MIALVGAAIGRCRGWRRAVQAAILVTGGAGVWLAAAAAPAVESHSAGERAAVGDASLAAATPPAPTAPLDLLDVGAPRFSHFGARNGLPEAVVVSVQTDRDGFVWASTPLGLARYDGHAWDSSVATQLPQAFSTLTLTSDGTLWAAYRDRGLAHYDGTRWVLEDRSTGLPTNRFRRITETFDARGNGQLWAVGWELGLQRRVGTRWVADPRNAELPPGPILSLAQTHTFGGGERLWAGSFNEGLWFRDGDGPWQRLRLPGFEPAQVEHLFTLEHDGREELWIAAFGTGLFRLRNDGSLREWSRRSGDLPSDELYDIASTPLPGGDHAIWVGSRSGLVRVHGDGAQVFTREHGLASDAVRGLSAWRSPNGIDVLWLATEAGVSRTFLGGDEWLTASLAGAHAIGVFAVRVEPDGSGGERLWLGATGDGINVFEHGHWRRYDVASGTLPDNDVRMLARWPDANGADTLWIGLRNGYLLRGDAPPFTTIATPWERHPGQAVMDMLVRRIDGRYEQWFATRQSGIYRLRDGAWTAFRPERVRGQWRIDKLIEQTAADGRHWLWATTNQGLARYDGERWDLLAEEAGLPDLALTGVTLWADAQGTPVLWVGSEHAGIVRIDVRDPAKPVVLPDTLPPPPDPNTYGALRDSRGRVYVCTNNGVQQLTPQADGSWLSRVFSRRDGMVNDECNTNAQWIDTHDRFWTGTLGGLTVYDPQRDVPDTFPKSLRLTGLALDGVEAGAPLRVPPGTHDVRVDFALLAWRREGESRFRTRIVGYEDEPGAWTAQNFRVFSALPPGKYVLHVEARDYAGNISAPLDVPFSVMARWWQTTAAQFGFTLLSAALLWALVQWRTRALQAQRGALERRVAQRTQELHEANARLLELSYRDALTGLANRRRLLETLEHEPVPGTPTALIFLDVDLFKDYNDRFGHPAGDEALRSVARVLGECAPPHALVARYGGEEFACLVPGMELAPAMALAERVRAAVADCDVPVPGAETHQRVTISAGVAAERLASPADAHALLRRADIALYRAKGDGRNCVRSAADG